ncbi:CubicO group peptidase (beta-lactamase class C family) [Tenacibaculum skagerrakense]|uniref:CubicO group peptidase (Beta-lactamase class C family) n=1 Tax=Tenacibaculum skagerrakense TaxID=186571 RepID=A0A4R2P0Y8_9FLAO|nr:serine hydrolase [Tenacibaculum skagerrakense]TCP28202.1 CubicO group peptidase (beta-lactamase class C family) [Tenacibaculum skagerrakense]
MKIVKRSLLLLFTVLLLIVFYNYPKLNIIAGYSAKMTGSSVFLAKRNLAFTDSTDTNFSPIHLAENRIDEETKIAYSSAFGLLNRISVYREGFGSLLLVDGVQFDKNSMPTPKRTEPDIVTEFPYGNAEPKDSIFSNINYDKLNASVNEMFNDTNKTRAVLVIYKDKIIVEKYDEGFDKNSLLLGWSMTKSITSTLFGILHCQGKLNVYDRAPFEEWKDDERKAITIHNLLQMNSGLEWNEDYNTISDVTKMLFLTDDVTKIQLNKPLTGSPNASWNYSSGTTNLLSGILRKQFTTHQEYLDFWYSALIDKIGMNSMVVETDMAGNYVGSSYAWATARDWAKFGLLYLHNGNWDGDFLFDEDWVEYATTPTPTSDGWYGAQIWLNDGGRYPDVPRSMFSFNGYQGQNVFILPEQEIVIVRLGLTKNADVNHFLSEVLNSFK